MTETACSNTLMAHHQRRNGLKNSNYYLDQNDHAYQNYCSIVKSVHWYTEIIKLLLLLVLLEGGQLPLCFA